MIEATGPTLPPLADDAHLLEPLLQHGRDSGSRAVAAYRDGDRFVDVGAAELLSRVRALAKGLIASGVAAGDRVALMSATRLEWLVVDYAILAAGAVTVPIYETSSAEQVHWILTDSGATIAIFETPAMAQLFTKAPVAAPDCREALTINEGGLEELTRRGADISDADLDARLAALTVDDLATIIYTSGTTGRPKGCMLTHRNLRTNVIQSAQVLEGSASAEDTTLLFLPLAHVLAKIIALVCVEKGAKICFATGTTKLLEEMPMAQPTMLVSVPRVFEKVYNGASHKAHSEGKGAIFDKAAAVATEWSMAQSSGLRRLVLNAEHAAFDKLVYSKIRAAFGGRLRMSFSGGGPLGERLTHFFHGIGVRILEGYGLTETSPTLTANRSDAWKPGTVGRPLAGTSIKIADDGEILTKGPQVFKGYWHNPAATAEVFTEDGWFRTGDVGELDDEGYLRITGRAKDLIVTAAGKNVAPAPLEDRLRAHALISQAVVVGERRPFIAALLALDEEALAQWAADTKAPGNTASELADNPELRSVLQAAVDDANQSVSRAESIRKFAILPRDLTIADSEVTPTLKVRRSTVEKTYADVIEDLYRA
ncbi:MAG TPA: long-chain fatty acid--CoA ligase [Acidimicrobiales bacterium]|nr:long-chain fatty acid--CoA ligase [Acidimicrobiales bacterium]